MEGQTLAGVAGEYEDHLRHPDGPLVRLHSACSFSELGDNPLLYSWLTQTVSASSHMIFSEYTPSKECDCKAQRLAAQAAIAAEGGVYFDLTQQEGRGAGLKIKREAYRLHADEGLDTVEAYARLGVPFDTREYAHCARFLLEDLGIDRVRLMTNNPRKKDALAAAGIRVTPVRLVVGVTQENREYLQVKRDKAGHDIPETLSSVEFDS